MIFFVLVSVITIGVQFVCFSSTEASDHWICNSNNQDIYVVEESINWVNDYRCSAGIKYVNPSNNESQTKARSREYFYENGKWYVSVMKSDPVLVDTSYENQLILNYLFSFRE